MIFSYYPGCTLSAKAQKLDIYARESADVLGFYLEEIDNWQCCGAVYPLGTNEVASKLPVIRALKAANDKERPLVTLCSACHHVFKRINDDMKHNADLRNIVKNYDDNLIYSGETEVLHYLEVIKLHIGFDKLKQLVQNPLRGRKIGAYYGCMLLRPGGVMMFDDPENPTIIEEFLRALGAAPVPFAYRNECCGGYISLKQGEKAAQMVNKIVVNAADKGADMLVTACPLCQYNISQKSEKDLPILYFTEILAEALGVKDGEAY